MKDGQTPGKMAAKARVVSVDGRPLTFTQVVLRMVGYYKSAIPLYLGFIWILFDRKGQGWHDKIAGTYVVWEGTRPKPGW